MLYYEKVELLMGRKNKLIEKLLEKPKDFTFDEMESLLSYRNYNGTVEYSKEDKCLFGKVIGIKSLLSYEGASVKELEKDFINVIDGYLADCKERNTEPGQPYKGTFNVG